MKPITLTAPEVRQLLNTGEAEVVREVKEANRKLWGEIPCDRCSGRGYHHGFGENGTDPDWCSKCGGPGIDFVPRDEKSPFGPAGSEHWCREAYGIGTRPDPNQGWIDGIEYKADMEGLGERDLLPLNCVEPPDDTSYEDLKRGWRSALSMKQWMSRLTVIVLSIRAEQREGQWVWVAKVKVKRKELE